jgi:V/A-type H+-transporting ATPase subunit E
MEKIQELTDKLYREGVEKGKAEGEHLVQQAQEEVAKMLADAKEQADKIIAEAKKEAQELDVNTRSELKLYAGQALNALKSEVANVITKKLVDEAVKSLSDNKDFIGKFMVAMAQSWGTEEPLVISTADAEGLMAYFKVHAKELLNKGVTIVQVNGKETSFSIAPADGSYKVNFGEEEFAAYFKEFLRPQLVEMLF